jgi:ABC-type uncharacterized transport system permease subunit
MYNPIASAIASTILICFFSGIFIFAIVDGALPIYWKVIICFATGILVYGNVIVMKQQNQQSKRFMNNGEDLR